MTKNLFKVIEINDGQELTIYQQKAGQFNNPRVYTGWRAFLIKCLIDSIFNRKEK